VLLDKVPDEKWNVLAPLPQWRNLQIEDTQAVEEVLPKSLRQNLLLEVAIGRGNQTGIEGDRLG
jgi:hypothetical protein